MKLVISLKGGSGSGHHGHAGRPGKRGGSLSGSIAVSIRTGRAAAIRAGWKPTSAVAGLPSEVLHIEDADSVFVQKHLEDLNKFPHKLHEHMGEHVNIYLGKKPMTELDDNEYLAGEIPRGWEDTGLTWDSVGGSYNSENGNVTLGYSLHGGSASLAAHEYGHAIGNVLGLDTSVAMRAHHRRLYSGLSPYLQGTGAGSVSGVQETFAEAIAEVVRYGDDAAFTYDKQFVGWIQEEVFNKWQ